LGFVFGAETGVYLTHNPDTVRGAGVTFIGKAKLKSSDDISRRWFLDVIPDLVVEVVSPNDATAEVDEKTALWLSSGVAVIWIIDPIKKTVNVHRKNHDVATFNQNKTLIGSDLLKGFSLPLNKIF
jgi:Uma2 family endonuclease